MLDAYWQSGMEGEAVFELFVRKLPAGRNFLLAAGLEHALDYLETIRFEEDEVAWLSETGRFSGDFLDRLARLRFTGSVHALPEGTVFFPNEPLVRVTAPLPEAQLVETMLMNILHFQTAVASKAARCVLAAGGRPVVDFGLRRAHGREAALFAARACHLAGFSGTSNLLAARLYGIPAFGTMAHSFVMATGDEDEAFRRFARARPTDLTLLIDTYDTELAAEKVARLAPSLRAAGAGPRAVRIDSGNLAEHSRNVRGILDRGGLGEVRIVASGNLDESSIRALVAATAPIDIYAVGTRLATVADAPYLECAYKLIEYEGRPTVKRSEGKVNLAGRKQVFRASGPDRKCSRDRMVLEGESAEGEALAVEAMRAGKRTAAPERLAEARDRAAAHLASLPESLRSIDTTAPFPVEISASIRGLGAKSYQG
jgi:nicotinate phosphoribosyltransferase